MTRTDLPADLARDLEHVESGLRDLRARIAAWVTDADRAIDRATELLPRDERGDLDHDSLNAVLNTIPNFHQAMHDALDIGLEEVRA